MHGYNRYLLTDPKDNVNYLSSDNMTSFWILYLSLCVLITQWTSSIWNSSLTFVALQDMGERHLEWTRSVSIQSFWLPSRPPTTGLHCFRKIPVCSNSCFNRVNSWTSSADHQPLLSVGCDFCRQRSGRHARLVDTQNSWPRTCRSTLSGQQHRKGKEISFSYNVQLHRFLELQWGLSAWQVLEDQVRAHPQVFLFLTLCRAAVWYPRDDTPQESQSGHHGVPRACHGRGSSRDDWWEASSCKPASTSRVVKIFSLSPLVVASTSFS